MIYRMCLQRQNGRLNNHMIELNINVHGAGRKELVDWIMKHSNVRQSPITRDNLLIADVDSKVKRRVPKLLLECSM